MKIPHELVAEVTQLLHRPVTQGAGWLETSRTVPRHGQLVLGFFPSSRSARVQRFHVVHNLEEVRTRNWVVRQLFLDPDEPVPTAEDFDSGNGYARVPFPSPKWWRPLDLAKYGPRLETLNKVYLTPGIQDEDGHQE